MNATYLKEILSLYENIGVNVTIDSGYQEIVKLSHKKVFEQGKVPQENVEKQSTVNVGIVSKEKDMPIREPIAMENTDNTTLLQGDFEKLLKEAKSLADNANSLQELRQAVESFRGLTISKAAINCVFAEGNSENCELMLIGEAPGANEDVEGRPFCGVSGRLLDKILNCAGYNRKTNCYITNSVFWRPPANRKPEQVEIDICRPFVHRHIELLSPKAIALVGGVSCVSVLEQKATVNSLRANDELYFSYDSLPDKVGQKIKVFVIYHPSFLLRQPSQKRNSWLDIIKIKNYIANIA